MAGLTITACSAAGAASSGSAGTASEANTLVAYTGQSGDYRINFNPNSPSQIGGIGTIYESLFFLTNVNTESSRPPAGTDTPGTPIAPSWLSGCGKG